MKRAFKSVNIIDVGIWTDVNPRLELADDDIRNLMLDIGNRGLIDPVEVWEHQLSDTDSKFVILKGHRRFAAVRLLEKRDPETYAEKFGGKIAAQVISDISETEALNILQDHGQQEGLQNPAEVYLTARNFFTIGGCTEKEVVMHIAGLLDRLSPPSVKQRDKINTAQRKVDDAANIRERQLAIKELEDVIFAYRRGMIQNINRIRRAPRIVEDSYLYDHTKKVRDGQDPDALIPNLTTTEIRKLYDTYSKEQDDSGGQYDREIPGPKFWELWNEIREAKEAEQSSDEPRAKAMSASKMEEEIKDGRFTSQVARLITKHHSGKEVNSAELLSADRRAYQADVLAKHNPDFWGTCIKAAEECIAIAREAAEAASKNGAGAAPATSSKQDKSNKEDQSN